MADFQKPSLKTLPIVPGTRGTTSLNTILLTIRHALSKQQIQHINNLGTIFSILMDRCVHTPLELISLDLSHPN
jgi:hypothetical protein